MSIMKIVLIMIAIILIVGGSFWALGLDFQDILTAYASAIAGGGHIH